MDLLQKIGYVIVFILFVGANTVSLYATIGAKRNTKDEQEDDIKNENILPYPAIENARKYFKNKLASQWLGLFLAVVPVSIFLSSISIMIGRGIEESIKGNDFIDAATSQLQDFMPFTGIYHIEYSFTFNLMLDFVTLLFTYYCIRKIVNNPNLKNILTWVSLDIFVGIFLSIASTGILLWATRLGQSAGSDLIGIAKDAIGYYVKLLEIPIGSMFNSSVMNYDGVLFGITALVPTIFFLGFFSTTIIISKIWGFIGNRATDKTFKVAAVFVYFLDVVMFVYFMRG